MNPYVTGIVLAAGFTCFCWSVGRRFLLLRVGRRGAESPWVNVPSRLARVWRRVLLHEKLYRYPVAGVAHQLIFLGFLVLWLRTLILWGRGFDSGFAFGFLGLDSPLGQVYHWLKDLSVLLVLVGVGVFLFYRLVRPQRRMTLNAEGLTILGVIVLMMTADIVYDAAGMALHEVLVQGCRGADCDRARIVAAPFANVAADGVPVSLAWLSSAFRRTPVADLVLLGHWGFWTHVGLVLLFLNWLPYSKHFHIIAAPFNVFFGSLAPPGRLRELAPDSASLLTLVESTTELSDELRAPLGVARIGHYSWKDLLDLYSCTECGRCSEHCPAMKSGKALDPKQLILDLREHLYRQQPRARELFAERQTIDARLYGKLSIEESPQSVMPPTPFNLVPEVVSPEALWACTTCRACEQECPVDIAHVEKIVAMRQNLVLVRGEHFPPELQRIMNGIETHGNPWGLPRAERGKWAEGLGVKTMADHPSTPVLLWVGCSASYDQRACGIARATASLLQLASVDFAILGAEESCTGDPARRAGNEYLFLTAAERNILTLERYRRQGGVRKIVTSCPHCYNTLANEYSTLGASYQVVHHSQLLLELLEQGQLQPRKCSAGATVIQDSCYLGRYNGNYDAPRLLLTRVHGTPPLEVPNHSRSRGGCCGAGGARMWLAEDCEQRVNVARTDALLSTGAEKIATSCPYCMAMIEDGLRARELDPRKNRDVAEVLWEACR